jgi:outer membrane receptor for monomeric catechols
MKVGYQGTYSISDTLIVTNDPLLTYAARSVQGGPTLPTSFTFRLPNWQASDRTSTTALYVEDTWTRNRLTLQGALRYDRASSFSPAEGNGTNTISQFNAAAITSITMAIMMILAVAFSPSFSNPTRSFQPCRRDWLQYSLAQLSASWWV